MVIVEEYMRSRLKTFFEKNTGKENEIQGKVRQGY